MEKKITLRDDQMPRQWYNVGPDIPNGLQPPLDPETKEVIAGFADEVRVDWIQDSSAQDESGTGVDSGAESDEQEPGAGNGSTGEEDPREEDSQREDVVDGRDIEIPSNLGGSMDLPKATVSPRGQVRHNARFVPAIR